jgi:hypothetical protein
VVAIDPENNRDGGSRAATFVALLFDPARVEWVKRGEALADDPVEIVGRGRTMTLSLSPGRLAPASSAFDLRAGEGVRKSLVAQFRVAGESLFVIANHWTSKWDDDRASAPANRRSLRPPPSGSPRPKWSASSSIACSPPSPRRGSSSWATSTSRRPARELPRSA